MVPGDFDSRMFFEHQMVRILNGGFQIFECQSLAKDPWYFPQTTNIPTFIKPIFESKNRMGHSACKMYEGKNGGVCLVVMAFSKIQKFGREMLWF